MARRHYQTITTYRGDGVTNRTVKSRNGYWGPYATPKQNQDTIVAILLLLLFAALFGWPLMITSISMSARMLIAVPWWAILIAFFTWAHHQGKLRRTGAPTVPAATATAAVATPQVTTVPTLTPAQLARAQENRARAIRAERASAAAPPARPKAPAPTRPKPLTVELTPAEKRDLEARYDAIKARMEAARQHLAEYERRQGDQKD